MQDDVDSAVVIGREESAIDDDFEQFFDDRSASDDDHRRNGIARYIAGGRIAFRFEIDVDVFFEVSATILRVFDDILEQARQVTDEHSDALSEQHGVFPSHWVFVGASFDSVIDDVDGFEDFLERDHWDRH